MKSFLSLITFFFVSILTHAQKLQPGDPAPEIQTGAWVKGTPFKKFEKDNLYVVEFWATWCGPCKESIPHLTKLAHEYKDKVRFIGVSVAETNTDKVAPFVEQMGSKMDYDVVVDQQESATARSGFMNKNWLMAAGQDGIPVAFVVGRTGNIEFIGSPQELDSALKLMVANSWDSKAFWEKWKLDKAAEAAALARYSVIDSAMKVFLGKKDTAAFYRSFNQYLEVSANDPGRGIQSVNDIIWIYLADPQGNMVPQQLKNPGYGIPWMEKLNARYDRKQPAFLDTLAWLYYASGDKSKALGIEQEALSLLKSSDPARAEYEKAISVFQK